MCRAFYQNCESYVRCNVVNIWLVVLNIERHCKTENCWEYKHTLVLYCIVTNSTPIIFFCSVALRAYRDVIQRMRMLSVSCRIGLHCSVLYWIVLTRIESYCIVLYCIVLYCIVLCCIALYCIVLYCIVLYCIVLYCIVLHRNTGIVTLRVITVLAKRACVL